MKPTLIAAAVLAGALSVACAPVQEGQTPPTGGAEPMPVACQAGWSSRTRCMTFRNMATSKQYWLCTNCAPAATFLAK